MSVRGRIQVEKCKACNGSKMINLKEARGAVLREICHECLGEGYIETGGEVRESLNESSKMISNGSNRLTD